MSEWIAMKEQLPTKPGEYFVLLSTPFKKPEQLITIDTWDGKDWADNPMSRDYMRWTQASHWMPVPELPKEMDPTRLGAKRYIHYCDRYW